MKATDLDSMLSEALCGGERPACELRLSQAESERLCACWPALTLTPVAESGGKTWYAVAAKRMA